MNPDVHLPGGVPGRRLPLRLVNLDESALPALLKGAKVDGVHVELTHFRILVCQSREASLDLVLSV